MKSTIQRLNKKLI